MGFAGVALQRTIGGDGVIWLRQNIEIRRFRPLLAGAFVALAATLLASATAGAGDAAATAVKKPNPWTMCAKATNRVERESRIPRQLLRAISKIESGRYHEGKRVVMAWPWTVMAEGRGRYLPSKQAAIAEVEELLARGVRNIDVGCMQVNLFYHGDAFANLEEAFDPLANVTYAAEFLTSLAIETGSWAKAVARYHSANPERYVAYRARVHTTWRKEREKYLLALERVRDETANRQAASVEQPQHSPGSQAIIPAALTAPAVEQSAVPLVALSFVRTLPAEPFQMPALSGPLHHPPVRSAMHLTGHPVAPVAINFSRSGPVAAADES